MSSHYYSEAASQLLLALTADPGNGPALRKAATLGCQAMRLLVKDLGPSGQLRASAQNLQSLLAPEVEEVNRVLHGSKALFEVFLKAEIPALLKAGMPANVATAVRARADEARKAIRFDSLNVDKLFWRAEELANEICSFATHAERSGSARSKVRTTAYALAGASTIAINASTDAVTTFGLAPWMTAVSGGLGGALISKPFSN